MRGLVSWLRTNQKWLFGGAGTAMVASILAVATAWISQDGGEGGGVQLNSEMIQLIKDSALQEDAVQDFLEKHLDKRVPPEDVAEALSEVTSLIEALSSDGDRLSRSDVGSDGDPDDDPFVLHAPNGDSITIDDLGPPRGIAIAPPEEAPRTVGLQMGFEPATAVITTKTEEVLDTLGLALQSEALKDMTFVIEGFTSGGGTSELNRSLSEQRAKTVRDYLVSRHGISRDRLLTIGRGEEDPVVPEDPEDPLNDRIEITALL